jgi:hypothetical protein
MEKVNKLTIDYKRIVKTLYSGVIVLNPFSQKYEGTLAIWDTGATNTAITSSMVKKLNLKAVGVAKVNGVHSSKVVNKYYIELIVKEPDIKTWLEVTECEKLSEDDSVGVLIGMDLITKGDFAVTNFNNKTVMSYISPAVKHIDFCVDKES